MNHDVMEDDNSPVWLERALAILQRKNAYGISLHDLLERYLKACVTTGQLDSWVPLGNSLVRWSLACYLTGVAEELGLHFNIPKKVARVGMAMSAIETDTFSQTSESELVSMFKTISDTAENLHPVVEAYLLIGTFDAKSWIHFGFDTRPQLNSLLIMQKAINRNPNADIRDPGGMLDELSEYINGGTTDVAEMFYKANPHFFHTVVSLHYPLTASIITGYQNALGSWNWANISRNTAISWSVDLIESFKDDWDWSALSGNPALPWDDYLIASYRDRWDWMWLSDNAGVPWSEDLIACYEDKWHWPWLSGNKSLPWSPNLLDRYAKRWDAEWLSINLALPWSIDLIEDQHFHWNFEYLSANKGLPWSPQLLDRYIDSWHWDEISKNVSIPWTANLLEACDGSLNWKFLSSNTGLPWSVELFERYIEKWNFDEFSKNKGFPWSLDFIDEHQGLWNWRHLSGNEALPWSSSLLEKYSDRWLWNPEALAGFDRITYQTISRNRGIPWSLDLLHRYRKKIDLISIADHFDGGITVVSEDRLTRLLTSI